MTTAIRKSQPTVTDVHVSRPLSNILVAFLQDRMHYAASSVFPLVPVEKQADLFWKFPKEFFLKDDARPRAPGTESAGGGFELETAAYNCLVEAWHHDIPDEVRANADSELQYDRAAAEFVAQKLLTRKEKRWLAAYFQSGVWGTDTGLANAWDTVSTNTLPAVHTAITAIWGATGFKPNVMVITPKILMALRDNDRIRDQFKYVSAESIDTVMLARYYGIDRIVVSAAVETTGPEGGTQATAFMAAQNVLIAYSAPSPSLMAPSAGYQFVWSGYLGSSQGAQIRRLRIDTHKKDRIEGEIAYDMKVIAPELGYLLTSAVA